MLLTKSLIHTLAGRQNRDMPARQLNRQPFHLHSKTLSRYGRALPTRKKARNSGLFYIATTCRQLVAAKEKPARGPVFPAITKVITEQRKQPERKQQPERKLQQPERKPERLPERRLQRPERKLLPELLVFCRKRTEQRPAGQQR
ncbi:hypothetical protein [Vogesella sp. LIG4]|uniref:hypothetical protein n=1 Tax=Vogesella sp. LIG4 TaxID=1192162 RepID=UPI0012FD3448|nr:hypothetical protein [Vogesella sp. LIG4]